ncbi:MULTISPECIES: hypothetical protein [Elizabethkingia]|uniref:hypothetical protein n=1 Tax=Elizabethkingia TaxID=308865 RepID=UPI0031597782
MKVKRGWLFKEGSMFYLMEGKRMIPFSGTFNEAVVWGNGANISPKPNKKDKNIGNNTNTQTLF